MIFALLILAASSFFFVTKIEGYGGNIPATSHVATSAPSATAATAATTATVAAVNTVATTTATTSTEISTETPTPAVSPTPPPLFSDDFVDNSKGWATGDVSGYTRVVGNQMLLLTATNHKMLIESIPTSTTYSDFSLTITFKLIMADAQDSMGLYLRGDSNLDHDYRIDIFGNNTYSISKETLDSEDNSQTINLAGPVQNAHLAPERQTNTLTMIMKGSQLTLILNGTVVQTLTDTDYKQGQIALFVSHGPASAGVSAVFNSIEIDHAPDQLPGTLPNTPTSTPVSP